MTIYLTLSRDQTLATAKSPDAIEQGRWVKTPSDILMQLWNLEELCGPFWEIPT